MAIVTGDRYLDLLARFVEEQAGGLLDGSLVLKLNPVGLHYVQTRLDALHELERIRTGAPVDYLRAYISDLGDHRALEQLSRVLSLLTAVKVVSVLPSPARDPSPVTLSPFGRLKSLELRGCDLSTSAARGLLQLRSTLERLICHNSADALRHIFTERIVEVKDSPVWSRLAFVSCAANGMVLMDESLQLLPVVQFLDLSRNHFAKAANLHSCSKLKFLDLGFNQLRNISSLRQIKSPITKLVLKNNALVSVHGIAALTTLEALDLSNNLISKFKEIKSVAIIPSLQTLMLEGNPLSAHAFYREEVFSFFTDASKVLLDGRKMRQSEVWAVNRRKSKRLKQEALYAPAAIIRETQTGVGHKDNLLYRGTCTPQEKPSRLALIHDAQMLLANVADIDETSGYHASSSHLQDLKDRWQDSLDEGDQDKLGAMQLKQKVESLKEEGSKTWLQELRILLDKNTYSSAAENSLDPFIDSRESMMVSKLTDLRKLRSRRQRRRQRRSYKEGTNREQEEVSEGWGEEDNQLFLARDQGGRSGEHTSLNAMRTLSGKDIGTSSLSASASSEILGDPEDMVAFERHSIEPACTDGSFESWKLLDEVVDSRGGEKSGLESPPHFHEDILQKRQNLEEELLRLSLDSGCTISSSESESSSDDSLIMISGSSRSEDSSPRGMTDTEMKTSKASRWNVWQGARHAGSGLEDNAQNYTSEDSSAGGSKDGKGMDLSDDQDLLAPSWPDIPKEKAAEAEGSSRLNPSCTDDIRANAGGGLNNAKLSVSKPRVKRKPRRVRTVELYKELEGTEKLTPIEGNGKDPEDCVLMPGMEAALSREKLHCLSLEEAAKHNADFEALFPLEDRVGNRVETFFRLKVANAEEEEVLCRRFRSGFVGVLEDCCTERDVHVVFSNKDKLYMIAELSSQSGKSSESAGELDLSLHVIASHRLQEVKKITVGLGLQAVRVDIGHGTSYLFVTRDINVSRDILHIFLTGEVSGPVPEFESWEQSQLRMFEELVLGGRRANILMYLMPLFSRGNAPEKLWSTRSIFVISHYIFVCVEDLLHFGASSKELTAGPPYFVMETAADIYDLLDVVVGFTEGCVTLHFGKATLQKGTQGSMVWKLKGVVGDAASKLVALLHSGH